MGIYGNILYGAGDYYGQRSKLAYSAEPVVSMAVDHDKVLLNWAAIEGDYTGLRLVRNQGNMPENEEDGVIVWEWVYYDDPSNPGFEDPSKPSKVTQFVDGEDNLLDTNQNNNFGLVGGKFAYYKIFMWTYLNEWTVAGSTSVLVPEEHTDKPFNTTSTHQKMLEILPRVFTSLQQSPTAEIDYTSDLAIFLEAFSLTYDELLTFLSLIQPSYMDKTSSPEVLKLQALQYALPSDIGEVTRAQKQTNREAIYMYQRKGTATAINTLAESTTGFNATVTPTDNLLLSMADSSFYNGVGNWLPVGSCTLASSHDVVPSTAEAGSYDNNYVGKVVISTTNAKITSGVIEPIKNAIPVSGGYYNFSYYAKTDSGTIASTPTIRWYNHYGVELSTSTTTALSSSTTWAKKSFTALAPGFVGVIESVQLISNVVTVWLTEKHPYAISDDIVITNALEDYNGTHTVTAVTDYSFSFALTASNETRSESTGTVKIDGWDFSDAAAYASLELSFGNTGTLYVDMFQLSKASTDYVEPRGVDVYLTPKKVNYLNNPAFDSGGTAWTSTSTLTYTAETLPSGFSGGTSVNMAAGTGTKGISTSTDAGLDSGFYCFSIWIKSTTGTRTGSLTLSAVNDIDDSAISTQTTTITITPEWTRFYVNLFVTDKTYFLDSQYSPRLDVEAEVTASTSDTFYFNSAVVERSFLPTDYFDGELASEYGAGWYGTAHESQSYEYPNKDVKIQRLSSQIAAFLPMETPWSITTAVGVEETGIS